MIVNAATAATANTASFINIFRKFMFSGECRQYSACWS